MKKLNIISIKNTIFEEISNLVEKSEGSVDFHNKLRGYLCSLALTFKHKGKIKYCTHNKKYIDVVWFDKNGKIKAVFEIDGGKRKRSVQRFLDVEAAYKIWLYYGTLDNYHEFISKYQLDKEVTVLYLGNIRKILKKRVDLIKKLREK